VPAPNSSKQLPPGSTYLLHLPGVAGVTCFDQWWLDALRDAKAVDSADFYDWTGHHDWLDVLHAVQRNHASAAQIASFIAAMHRANPACHILMSSESGGTGVAVWALEALPPDVIVDEVVLIAPSMSPRYDLSAALRHVRGRMYYFTSPADDLTNGLGTSFFGTIDGKRCLGAGLVGFYAPNCSDAREYGKLVRMPYDLRWMVWGNFGLHTGGMSAPFARNVLAPMLIRDEKRLSELGVAPQLTSSPPPASPPHAARAVSWSQEAEMDDHAGKARTTK
jgi:hypothetical protein